MLSVMLAGTLGLAFALVCPAADTLDDVLNRIDVAAKQFKSYSANVKRLDYEKALDSTDQIDGAIHLKRAKNGIVGNMDFTEGPDHYTIHLDGPKVEKYIPSAATVQEFDFKKFAHTMDETLLLGFAVTRDEMQRDYNITLAGTETIDGKPAAHLMLTPKSADALQYIKSIELWIPQGSGNPIRQKGTEPSGNYRLATYSDIKLNPALPDSAFDLVLPPGTKRVKGN